jgi:hypothetical protein
MLREYLFSNPAIESYSLPTKTSCAIYCELKDTGYNGHNKTHDENKQNKNAQHKTKNM